MEKQYIRSERAHVMCPNMHFAILADIKAEFKIGKIKTCLDLMAQAHPFLRSIISCEKDSTKLYYKIEDKSRIDIMERESVHTIWKDYHSIALSEWNVFQNGLLKVFLYPIEKEMKVLFIAHHLLGDGRCLLEIVNEFANLYAEGIEPIDAPERLIQRMEDLPGNSELTGVSKYLVRYLNRKWRKEEKQVSYEHYVRFSEQFVKDNPVSYEVSEIEQQEFLSMKQYCDDHQITINDLLMSKLFVKMQIQKIVIAADIRSKLSCYHNGTCGNYATAMGIVCRGKHTDILQKAEEVHKQVKKHMGSNKKLMLVLSCYLNMDEGLIDAAAIATLGDFESRAAKFVGGNMFGFLKRDGVSITNLGRISNANIRAAIFIPPASPAMLLTIGALTVNDTMRLCGSYYENSISGIDVKNQLAMLGSE